MKSSGKQNQLVYLAAIKCLVLLLGALLQSGCGESHSRNSEKDSQIKSFSSSNSLENLSINGEWKTYEKNGTKVHLIDMIHIGPESYYLRVQNSVKHIIRNSEKVIILREGYYCDSKKLDSIISIENPEAFDPKFLPGFAMQTKQEVKESIDLLTIEELIALESNSFIKVSSCLEFVKDRPENISKTYRNLAEKYDLVAQESLKELFPSDIDSIRPDLELDSLKPSQKLVFGLYVSCLTNMNCSKRESSFLNWLENDPGMQAQVYRETLFDIIHAVRNKKLYDAISDEVEKGVKDIIVPWGEAHMDFLYQELQNDGFKQVDSQEIQIASCEEVESNALLKQLFGEKCEKKRLELSQQYFCKSFELMRKSAPNMNLGIPAYCSPSTP